MKKKQIKHFVPNKDVSNPSSGFTLIGIPACGCYRDFNGELLKAFNNETAKDRKDTNCKRCRKTKVFRKKK